MEGWVGGLAEHGLVQHRSLGGHVGRGLDRRGWFLPVLFVHALLCTPGLPLLLDLQAFSLLVSCACTCFMTEWCFKTKE